MGLIDSRRSGISGLLLRSMEYNFTHTQLRSCWPGPDRRVQGYSVDQDKVRDTLTHKPVHVHVRTKAPHISVTDFQHSPAILAKSMHGPRI